MTDLDTDIAIVGGGLSGLAIAEKMVARGQRVVVFEARDRVGGRILSVPGPSNTMFRYDLGPAWIWPHNHRMLDLAQRLGVTLMPQHASGNLVFQDANGSVDRGYTFSTMAGVLRAKGGLACLPEALADLLPDGILHLGHRIDALSRLPGKVQVSGMGPDGAFRITAKRVVLAMPPRVVAQRIAFTPGLSGEIRAALDAVPTWMAGHAKVVAIYPNAFWRQAGLSGDAISHIGPLMEIHDASPVVFPEEQAALFGFVHPDAIPSQSGDLGFQDRVLAQLVDLFGPEAGHPIGFHLKAWGRDPETAVASDQPALGGHSTYYPIAQGQSDWQGRVFFSGTETAATDGGFLEGALEAAENAIQQLEPSSE